MPVSSQPSLSLSPSLIAASPLNLEAAVRLAEQAGSASIHIDIMDGHFVPNLTYGPDVVKALRPITPLFFDVHLMVQHPATWIAPFAHAGANAITIHPEATADWLDVIQTIQGHNCQAGLALNPQTDMSFIPDTAWAQIDRLLIMSVNPGFSGQTFLDNIWDKLRQASLLKLQYPHLIITVDGGVNSQNIARVAQTTIDNAVIGSAFYHQPDPIKAWHALETDMMEMTA